MIEKTGCLITADGSEDEKIQPEGLPEYRVPPPSILDPDTGTTAAPIPQAVSVEQENDDENDDDFEGDDIGGDAEIVVDETVASDGWIFDLFQ